jgi:hypothetical protein
METAVSADELLTKWRAHIEAHKFQGPTIKLLQLEDGLWAILDHEYNFIFVAEFEELSWRILEVQHPPQRERPKPKVYRYDELATVSAGETITITGIEDLDL